jgi:hypothetical protein
MSRSTEPRQSSNSVSWVALCALAAGVCAAELRSPLKIDINSLVALAVASVALTAAAFFYSRGRVDEKLSATCIGVLQALLFSALGAVLSYLLAREGGALWDSTLQSWDQALGLDWLAYVRFVDSHPWLVPPLRLAYGSLIPQIIVVILALGFRGRLDQLRIFILAAILSGTVAILLSPLFPAVGNFAHLGLSRADFHSVWQWSMLADVRDFEAVRSGALGELNLRTMQGIIVFPSYHGCLAFLTLWAFWNSGLRWLRAAGCAVALTTLAATPVDGGHYFVDVFAGIAIAAASVAAASRLAFIRVPFPAVTRSLEQPALSVP